MVYVTDGYSSHENVLSMQAFGSDWYTCGDQVRNDVLHGMFVKFKCMTSQIL